MPKVRLGVVLLVPPPLDCEIDAFRRATGDGTYGRVPAHLTLVPPVNVRDDRRPDAVAVLRAAAADTAPATLELGPPATFLPANPVLYLPVLGEGVAWVEKLRARVFAEPLSRPLTWPFVPHVTLADEADPDRIAAAQQALGGYRAEMTVDRVHLLEEGPGRVWAPTADFGFAPAAVVGRGGLPVELTVSEQLDPDAMVFAAREWEAHDRATAGLSLVGERFAVTARRDGTVLGAVEATTRAGVAQLRGLIVGRPHRGQGVGTHLMAAFESEAARRGHTRLTVRVPVGSGAEAFCRRQGWVDDARLPRWYAGRDYLQLRREL